jgi:ATP-dependent DNA ligase
VNHKEPGISHLGSLSFNWNIHFSSRLANAVVARAGAFQPPQVPRHRGERRRTCCCSPLLTSWYGSSAVEFMKLTIAKSFAPMEALSVATIPSGPDWQYEPKWDGFRCLVFRDGKVVELVSKAGKPLTRYFPELVAQLAELKPKQFVLDGEIVVPAGKSFSFDSLLQRLHPAASRVNKLSIETPALFIAFDLLEDVSGPLSKLPLRERRERLQAFFKKHIRKHPSLRLSPATQKLASAKKWLKRVGSALDGIIAKRVDLPYASGTREGMQKIKNYRSADCVVGGFRYNQGETVVGSLLLGLYDKSGKLNHVGFTSALSAREKPALTVRLEKLIGGPGFTGNAPGGPSRWASSRSTQWQPLKPKLVVEVCYDHFSGDRFRHGTQLQRWRPDKSPRQCTMDQLLNVEGDLTKLLNFSARSVLTAES